MDNTLYALTPIDQTEGLKKVKQTKLHNPPIQNGNCFRAVISTITSIPIDAIPAIEERDDDAWHIFLFTWLRERGWTWRGAPEFEHFYKNARWFDELPVEAVKDKLYLVSGKTNRFGGVVNHVCIYMNGTLWHDPHPDNSGLTTQEYFEVIEPSIPNGHFYRPLTGMVPVSEEELKRLLLKAAKMGKDYGVAETKEGSGGHFLPDVHEIVEIILPNQTRPAG
jgi:hypothetical protein